MRGGWPIPMISVLVEIKTSDCHWGFSSRVIWITMKQPDDTLQVSRFRLLKCWNFNNRVIMDVVFVVFSEKEGSRWQQARSEYFYIQLIWLGDFLVGKIRNRPFSYGTWWSMQVILALGYWNLQSSASGQLNGNLPKDAREDDAPRVI